jgi:VWFA-related protein
MRPATPVLVALLAAAPLPAQAPAPAPTPLAEFPVEIGSVEIDAIVTDDEGRPIRDLTAADFTVLEDGKPQVVEFFRRVDLPFERPAAEVAPPAVEVDVRSNERPFEGRVYVLVLDDLHIAPARSGRVKQAARKFLEENVAEGDMAAVVHTGGGSGKGQELTGSRRLLLAAVDRLIGRKLPSVTLSRIEEYRRQQGFRRQDEAIRDPETRERVHNARAALETLESVSRALAGIRGRRKAVLFFSEGIDLDIHDTFTNPDASDVLDQMRRATSTAAGANVSFYTVDPRGLGGAGDEMMEIQPVFDDPRLGLDTQGLARDVRRAQDVLRTLADETSGLAAVDTNDFAGAFARVVKDSSAYYVLGYTPAGARPGRFHKLDVRVSRPGARVRARSGYSLPRAREADARRDRAASRALAELLDVPVPRSGLPLTLHAAPFRGPKGKASVLVTVQVGGRAFRFAEKDGAFRDTLELAVVAVDTSGKVTGGDQKVDLNLKPRTREMVDAAGFRVLSWLELPPGRYQVRAAGRAVNEGRSGSVFADLEVPDFDDAPMALSGLVVTSAVARHVPTAGELRSLQAALPGAPTTWRTFHPADTMVVLAELYDGEKSAHTVDFVTTLTASDGTVAFRGADERSAASAGAAGATIVHTAQLPLKSLAPGLYTLRVEARSRMGRNPPSAERALLVEVLAPS